MKYLITIDTDIDLEDEIFSWVETGLESFVCDGELDEFPNINISKYND